MEQLGILCKDGKGPDLDRSLNEKRETPKTPQTGEETKTQVLEIKTWGTPKTEEEPETQVLETKTWGTHFTSPLKW